MVDRISNWAGLVVCPLVILITLVLVYEVVMRYVLNLPTNWAHELSQFIFGYYFMLGAGYTLLRRGHVAVDFVHSRLSIRQRAIVDLFGFVIFFLFCGVLLYKGSTMTWDAAIRGLHSHSYWAPPLAPMMVAVPIGTFLLLLQGLAKFIHDLMTAMGKKEAI